MFFRLLDLQMWGICVFKVTAEEEVVKREDIGAEDPNKPRSLANSFHKVMWFFRLHCVVFAVMDFFFIVNS